MMMAYGQMCIYWKYENLLLSYEKKIHAGSEL